MLIVFKTYESFDRTYIGRALERGSRKRALYLTAYFDRIALPLLRVCPTCGHNFR
jgi:hypothetical protein